MVENHTETVTLVPVSIDKNLELNLGFSSSNYPIELHDIDLNYDGQLLYSGGGLISKNHMNELAAMQLPQPTRPEKIINGTIYYDCLFMVNKREHEVVAGQPTANGGIPLYMTQSQTTYDAYELFTIDSNDNVTPVLDMHNIHISISISPF